MGCGPSVCHFVTLEADGPFRSATDGSASDALTTRMRVLAAAGIEPRRLQFGRLAQGQADFATWLVMAKLGGFDDLPSNAQKLRLTIEPTRDDGRARLTAVREVYSAITGAREPKIRQRAKSYRRTAQISARSMGETFSHGCVIVET